MPAPEHAGGRTRPRVGFVGPAFAVEAVRDRLGDAFETVAIPVDGAELRAALPDLDGLIEATTRLPVDADALASAPRLRIVSVAGTGANHVDRVTAAARGITVRSLAEDRELLAELTPTAEHTWGLVLALARRTVPASRHVASGRWERERFPGQLLHGRRLGIVGLGRLGRWVARYGAAFGMHVSAHDPSVDEDAWPDGIGRVTLAELFASSDVVSVHVPLDASTVGLVDASLLALLPDGAILVNTSRGAIVDEAALLHALRTGRLGGAALDVLAEEPPSADHPLVAFAREDDRLLITPHLGGFVPDIVVRVCVHAAGKVADLLASDDPAPGGAR
jgi:phosphoglycerate dehydrogenase-like enzyme